MGQPFYIAVCDDEAESRDQIRNMTEEICRQEKIEARISVYTGPEDLMDFLKKEQQKNCDLLLLDVMLPEKDGLQLSKEIRDSKIDMEIVLVSVNKEMALKGYEVEAARYLAKPLEQEKLREAICYCYGRKQKSRALLFPVGGELKQVSPNDISYIEIVGRKTRVRLQTEEWDTTMSMSDMEEMLKDRGFIRCHQSFLVNCQYIKSFRASAIMLMDGKMIPVSKHRVKETRQAFFDYIKN